MIDPKVKELIEEAGATSVTEAAEAVSEYVAELRAENEALKEELAKHEK